MLPSNQHSTIVSKSKPGIGHLRIGKAAEKFAITWERQQLESTDISDLIATWITENNQARGMGMGSCPIQTIDVPYVELKTLSQIR